MLGTHSPCTMQHSSTNDRMEWKLRKDKQVRKGEFSNGDGKKICYLITEETEVYLLETKIFIFK